MTTTTGELLVGDTSFISSWARAVERRQVPQVWPLEIMRRVSSATFGISSVTFGEMRHGQQVSRWGERRVREAERWLHTFVQFPVDADIAETWAGLKAAGQRRGRAFAANDLWVAATGRLHGVPVVTCDRDFLPMRELGVQVIYLPRKADSRKA
jgi:predicted nucleic acid-binding protein